MNGRRTIISTQLGQLRRARRAQEELARRSTPAPCPRCEAPILRLLKAEGTTYWVDARPTPLGRWEWVAGTVTLVPATDASPPERRHRGHHCPRPKAKKAAA